MDNAVTKGFLANFPGKQIYVSKPDKTTGTPYHFYGEFDDVEPKLRKQEGKQWGTFFTVNELDRDLDPTRNKQGKRPWRTKKMFERARAVWIDDDANIGKRDIESFPAPPNIIVTTSPGKYHYYWLTSTNNQTEWERVMRSITNNFGGDQNAKDISRILRLPGFTHNKSEPFDVTFEQITDKIYEWEYIKKIFPLETGTKSTKTKEEKSSSVQTEGKPVSGGNFDTISAIQQILSAENYHGSLTSLALRYVNKGMDRDEICIILRGIGELANKREEWESRFNHEHLYECIDSAFRIVDGEKTFAKPLLESEKVRSEIPEFPKDTMLNWPEPWPMIWSNFKKLPRTLDECLLFPTVITVHAFLLNAIYVNSENRRPNMAFLNIAPSTGNKDVNSKNVLHIMTDIMQRKDPHNLFFHRMLGFPENITADTSFLESFSDGDLFWINTEATALFQQLVQGANLNSSVRALGDKLIEVVDGLIITSKAKAGKAIPAIKDPNAQILLYTQPETVEQYLTPELITRGFLGRFLIHIATPIGDNPFDDAFLTGSVMTRDIEDELAQLYRLIPSKSESKIQIKPTTKDIKFFQKWMINDVAKLSEGDDSVKMLKRLGISTEQLYTVILGICKRWDRIKNRTERKEFDIQCMMPILNYWAKCKAYVIKEYMVQDLDPLYREVLNVIIELITKQVKSPRGSKFIDKYNAVPRGEVTRVIQSRTRLKRQLDARGDNRNVLLRTQQIIDSLIKHGELIEFTISNKLRLVGFPTEEVDSDS